MEALKVNDDWEFISQFLPSNLDELAKSSGAVVRWRNIKNGNELVRLNLAYVVEDLSLRSTAAWSAHSELAEMKDTSVLHRLRHSVPLLEIVLAHLLNFRVRGESAEGPTMKLNDATVISIPGSKGTDWRIHAVYNPITARLSSIEVTDFKGGESLGRHPYQPGDVVIGDRGLAHARGIHAVDADGAYSLLRMHWQNIRLTDEANQPLELNDILARAKLGDTGTIISVPLKTKMVRARLIVRPQPPAATEKARANLRRNAAKKGRTPSDLALRLAGYFCVLTTIPVELASDEVILELYRIRWQIELFFKRCKSLLRLDHLRADDPQLVKSYCLCKLIEVVLIELLAGEGKFFSPWGTPRKRYPAGQSLAANATASH
jgi:hypothetical protein